MDKLFPRPSVYAARGTASEPSITSFVSGIQICNEMTLLYLLRKLIQTDCHAVFSGSFQRLHMESTLLNLELSRVEGIFWFVYEGDSLPHYVDTVSIVEAKPTKLCCITLLGFVLGFDYGMTHL